MNKVLVLLLAIVSFNYGLCLFADACTVKAQCDSELKVNTAIYDEEYFLRKKYEEIESAANDVERFYIAIGGKEKVYDVSPSFHDSSYYRHFIELEKLFAPLTRVIGHGDGYGCEGSIFVSLVLKNKRNGDLKVIAFAEHRNERIKIIIGGDDECFLGFCDECFMDVAGFKVLFHLLHDIPIKGVEDSENWVITTGEDFYGSEIDGLKSDPITFKAYLDKNPNNFIKYFLNYPQETIQALCTKEQIAFLQKKDKEIDMAANNLERLHIVFDAIPFSNRTACNLRKQECLTLPVMQSKNDEESIKTISVVLKNEEDSSLGSILIYIHSTSGIYTIDPTRSDIDYFFDEPYMTVFNFKVLLRLLNNLPVIDFLPHVYSGNAKDIFEVFAITKKWKIAKKEDLQDIIDRYHRSCDLNFGNKTIEEVDGDIEKASTITAKINAMLGTFEPQIVEKTFSNIDEIKYDDICSPIETGTTEDGSTFIAFKLINLASMFPIFKDLLILFTNDNLNEGVDKWYRLTADGHDDILLFGNGIYEYCLSHYCKKCKNFSEQRFQYLTGNRRCFDDDVDAKCTCEYDRSVIYKYMSDDLGSCGPWLDNYNKFWSKVLAEDWKSNILIKNGTNCEMTFETLMPNIDWRKVSDFTEENAKQLARFIRKLLLDPDLDNVMYNAMSNNTRRGISLLDDSYGWGIFQEITKDKIENLGFKLSDFENVKKEESRWLNPEVYGIRFDDSCAE